MDSLTLNIVVIIVAAFTGGDGEDNYVFNKPTFDTKEECTIYVKEHYNELNIHVNKNYKYRLDNPNLFYCIERDLFSKRLNELRKKHLTGV